LLRIAPDLVRRVPFHIPVYRSSSRPPWMIRAGLTLYAALGGFGAPFRFSALPRAQWGDLDGLETRELRAVYRYHDAQTDDAALTRAVLHSAQSLGAELCVPAEFVGARALDEGIEVSYRCNGRDGHCRARVLVNAAGPWVETVAQRVSPPLRLPAIELIQGTHIVLNAVQARGMYYVEAPSDRRAVFVMSWKGAVLVGTTEHRYSGDPAAVKPLPKETDYLLEAYRHYFPRASSVAPREAFAGLRVLPRAEGSAFHRPRDTLIVCDDARRPRAVAIVGGKLTAYRATAAKVLDRIAPSLPSRRPLSDTSRLPLYPVAAERESQ
jgi:glycerol-3-phosphate dehydrogenase